MRRHPALDGRSCRGAAGHRLAEPEPLDARREPVIDIGPRIEVGYGWVSGTPVDPTDVGTNGGSVVALLAAHARLSGHVGGRFYAFADLELGHSLAGLDATVDSRSTSGIAGPALAAHLGVRGGI